MLMASHIEKTVLYIPGWEAKGNEVKHCGNRTRFAEGEFVHSTSTQGSAVGRISFETIGVNSNSSYIIYTTI